MEIVLEEHGSTVAISEQDVGMEFFLDDCGRAFSGIVHEEKMLEDKRRWLMALPMKNKYTQESLRIATSFRNVCLPESFVRSDDVCLQGIRAFVQRGFRAYVENRSFKRTHSEMRQIIEQSPPELLAQSRSGDHFERVNSLLQIFSHITTLTPISSSLVSSISKLFEGLEVLPSQALIAMNRKLKNVTVIPQFPVVFSYKKNKLVDRLRKKCHRMVSALKEGNPLPKSLAKALSVMCLSLKQITKQVDILTTKIFPVTSEIEELQNETLKAIWLLPNVRLGELKHLQYLIAPDVKLPPKSLRRSLHNYLMEYLFQCDEVHPRKPFLMVLKLINKRSQEETVGEEVEAILNVSSQLRQIIWDLFPDQDMDQEFVNAYPKCLDTNETDCDIIIDENEDCSTFGYSEYVQNFGPDDEVEGTGDSMSVNSHLIFKSEGGSSAQLMEGRVACNSNDEQEQDQQGSSVELHCHLSPSNVNMTNRYLALRNICDETSLVAYKLIGHLMEEFVQKEGKKLDEATELYLRGGASSTSNFQDPEKAPDLLENLEVTLHQIIGDVMPFVSK